MKPEINFSDSPRHAGRSYNRDKAALAACAAAGIAETALQTGLFPSVNGALVGALENPADSSIRRIVALLLAWFSIKVGLIAISIASQIFQSRRIGICIAERKARLFRHVLFASPEFHATEEPERIAERIETGTEESVPFFATAPAVVPIAILSLVWALWQMFLGTPRFLMHLGLEAKPGNVELAALAVVSAGIVVAATSIFEKRKTGLYRTARSDDEDARSAESEALHGIIDLRGAGALAFAANRVARAVESGRTSAFRFQSLLAVFSGAGGFAFCLAETAVLGGSVRLIFGNAGSGGFAYSDYVRFATLCACFNGAALSLFSLWQDARKAWIAKDRLVVLDQLDMPFASKTAGAPAAASAMTKSVPSLSFRSVAFSVPDGTRILSSLDLNVAAGSHVAIVGPSGCGKSTLLKLVMRHLEPTSGHVEFAGIPIPDWNYQDFAKRVAYVSQRPTLFEGSIRENIILGRQIGISDDRLLSIADKVGLRDDLERKAHDGVSSSALDFQVGPGGRNLSGGQAAKIALMRALVGSPDLLVLDEATAPLDELSQERVASYLAGPECRDKTIISVSHRLPAVRNMDRIVVMDRGRIVQDGTWNELASRTGLFADLIARETGARNNPSNQVGTSDGFEGGYRNKSGESAIVRALSLSATFADLDSGELARLASKATLVETRKGDFVIRKGDGGDSLFVVTEGAVIINGIMHGPGSVFGEIALFGGVKRTADVRAECDSTFAEISRDDVLSICRNSPGTTIRILAAVSRIAAKNA